MIAETPAFSERDPNYLAVRQLFRDYFGRDVPVDLTVGSGDDMFAYSCAFCQGRPIGTMAYFRAGLSIYDCVADVAQWKFGGLSNAESFLDFASGHGRFTRVLAAVYPKEKIWAAEILSDAVRFQGEQLGVHALQTTTVPEEFDPGRRFDFIYVGSLFTHLPERTFTRWLKQLYQLLTPNGILVFTTHSPEHLPKGVTMPASGIHYIASTEIPSLDTEDYGATMVTKQYVQGVLRQVTGKDEHWYQWRALGFLQDLWIISKAPLPQQPFVYDQGPQGHLDDCDWHTPTRLLMRGWSACICPGHTIQEIQVSLNNELIGRLHVEHDREDIVEHLKNPGARRSGWRGFVQAKRHIDPWRDILSIVAVCSGGKRYSVRTVAACTALQFPPGVMPMYDEEFPLTPRAKIHRALDYALDGDVNALGKNALALLRRR